MSDDYRGPTQIYYAKTPRRGTTYFADFDGHRIQVYVTAKAKKIRVWVNNKEWKDAEK